jgi:hypothetical protein
VVAWNCWNLRATTDAAAYLDDSSVHEQMVRFATNAVQAGRLPLSQWFPYLGLGSPQFVHYQSLGAMLTGLAGVVVGPDQAFRWSLYLMVCLWPLAIYFSARIFGIGRAAAAAAGVLSPFLVSVTAIGYERGAYLWTGYGVWAQLWGSWALPFAWATTWRAMRDPRYLWPAAALVAITTALHFETGYLAFLGVVVLAAAAAGPLGRRLARAAVVLGASLAAAAWVIVPVVLTARWAAVNELFASSPLARGYGAGQDLVWLLTGRVFDAGRFPVISLAVLAGAVLAVARWRRDPLCRGLLVLFVASLFLSFGPTTWGALADAVPGHADLFFRRFMMGAQLAGLYLAGTGAVAAGSVAARPLAKAWRWVTAGEATLGNTAVFTAGALSFAGALLIWPAVSQTSSYDGRNTLSISTQRVDQASEAPVIAPLIAYIKTHGGGRTYAGMPDNWGASFSVGLVPVFKYLESQDVDEVGYTLRTASLMTGPEYYFDQAVPSDYVLFGIRYLVLPSGMASPVPAQEVMQRGAYALWTIRANGYLEVVRVTGRFSANRADVGRRSLGLLHSSLLSRHQDWEVNWDGERAPGPLAAASVGVPGGAKDVRADLAAGTISATVDMNGGGTVLLSASYDPGWQAWVDGHRAPTEMLAPAVVGVNVGPGLHRVLFRYVGPQRYPELVALGIAGLGTALLLGRRWGRAMAARGSVPA